MSNLAITWTEKTVALNSLVPYERNPRLITKKAFNKLKESLQTFGYHQRIIVQPDLKVIGGHQRIRALEELGVQDVTVLIPSRELSIEEFKKILIADNLPFGEFDFDILSADYTREELQDIGMPDFMLDRMKRLRLKQR